MNRRELLILISGTMTVAPTLRAQQKAMPVIGLLRGGESGSTSATMAAFRQGLSETGWVEGQNVAIEFQSVEGRYNQLPVLVADLVGRKVDIIAVTGMPTALAAKSATSTIPIVFIVGTDPVAPGRAATFRAPPSWQPS